MALSEEEKVYRQLDELGITYEKHQHPPVYTVEQADRHWQGIKGAHCKNIFVRNKKGNHHYLIIVEHKKRVELAPLSKSLGETRFSFASAERLKKQLGLEPGSVSPFGLINNSDSKVRVLIDSELSTFEQINFHPNVNTATITLSYVDFDRFLGKCGNEVSRINL